MERRTFIQNLGVLFAASAISVPAATANDVINKIDNQISKGQISDGEIILRFEGNYIRSPLVGGSINYQRGLEYFKTRDDPFETFSVGGLRSCDIDIELNTTDKIYTLANDLMTQQIEMSVKISNTEYFGNVYISSLEIGTDITLINMIASGELQIC